MRPLPAFPTRPASFEDAGRVDISLRSACTEDLPFLRRLYAHSRAEEMASVPWPDTAKHQFLDSQFDLQHTHYIAHYPCADFLIVETDEGPVGRLYVEKRDAYFHVIDVSLLGHVQGKGMGTALLSFLQATAATRGHGVTLQVSRFNLRAKALYARLGFAVTETGDTHVAMRWVS